MAWIEYKKAYDMISQSWIINCLKMYKTLDEVTKFIEKTMKTLRVELIEHREKRSKEVYSNEMHYHLYYL